MTAQEIRGPNFVLCLILVVCSLALVTGTDSGGLCLMMAQDACVVVSSQLTKAGIDRNYAEACRLVCPYTVYREIFAPVLFLAQFAL